MKSGWIEIVVVCFVTTTWTAFVPAAESRRVHFGWTVRLGCNVSYLHHTTWLKQNPDGIPTVVVCGSLRDGRPAELFQLSPRHSVMLMNRSLGLRIAAVEAGDLGLYYCVANVNGRLIIGGGTRIHNSSRLTFLHWYSVGVGSGLMMMILSVCITCWKTRLRRL